MVDDSRGRPAHAERSTGALDAEEDRFRTLELSGTVFLIDEKTGASYPIGAHGRRILVLLSAGSSVEDAAWTLAVETGNDVSVVLEATRRLVSNLVDIGVVVDQRS